MTACGLHYLFFNNFQIKLQLKNLQISCGMVLHIIEKCNILLNIRQNNVFHAIFKLR